MGIQIGASLGVFESCKYNPLIDIMVSDDIFLLRKFSDLVNGESSVDNSFRSWFSECMLCDPLVLNLEKVQQPSCSNPLLSDPEVLNYV